MSEQLNLTEIMTVVQNFITSDGQIIPAQRDFYRILRDKMNHHTGVFNESEVELILLDARSEVLELSDEDYGAIHNVVMERFGFSKKLEEEARLRAELVEKERLRKEAELKARAEAIAQAKAEAEEKLRIAEEKAAAAEAKAKAAEEKAAAEKKAKEEAEMLLVLLPKRLHKKGLNKWREKWRSAV